MKFQMSNLKPINDANYPPSRQLYADIKAAFVQKEMTITAWCKANGCNVSNVRMAIFGSWDGPKAKAARHRAIKASGLNDSHRKAKTPRFKKTDKWVRVRRSAT